VGGCATNHQSDNAWRDSVDLKYAIYGKLEKQDDGYHFTEFSEGYVETQPWVRLTDMKPMWNTQKEDCVTGIPELTSKDVTCKTHDEKFFRSKGTDFTVKKTVGWAVFSALSLGVAAAMPPAAVEFNQREYLSAVREATNKLNSVYEPLGQNYLAYLNEYNAEMTSLYELYEKVESDYIEKDIPIPTPVVNLRDESGLFGGNVSGFKKRIAISKNAIPSKDNFDDVGSSAIDDLVSLTRDRNSIIASKLRNAESTLWITCSDRWFARVHYTITCPKKVNISSAEFEVDVVVESMSYRNILPKSISEEDESIRVVLRDEMFYLQNKTSSFITVDSISFYHNGKIATVHKLEGEWAPSSEGKLISLSRFPIATEAIGFSNITKSIALSTKVEFGVALKYRIINRNIEKTLFKTNKYQLMNLL
jgi:hypothetical protein